MPSFFERLTPSTGEIRGREVRMMFNMRAAAKMEAALGKSYPAIVMEMLQIPQAEGEKPDAMPVQRQAEIIKILMEEAGQNITIQELSELHMLDFAALARLAQREILLKSPDGKAKTAKKNAPQSQSSTGQA